jgi:hypothetical protein
MSLPDPIAQALTKDRLHTTSTDEPKGFGISRSLLLKRLGIITFIVFISFIMAEMIVRTAVYWAQAPQSYSKEFDIKYALAQRAPLKDTNTILLLGNSHIWHALFPELITHQLKRADYSTEIRNLGVNGTTPEMNLFLLKKALKANVKPKLVVYNVAPILLNHEYYADPSANPEQAFQKSYIGQCYFQTHLQATQKWSCILKKNIQLARYREWVLQQVMLLSQSYFLPSNKPTAPVLGAAITENSPNGWSPAYELVSEPFDSKFTAPEFLNAVKNGKSLSNFQWDLSHLEKMKTFCQEQHIPLLMIWLPEHPAMKTVYRHFGLPPMAAFKQQFHTLSYPEKQVWFLDFSESDTNSDHFYNPDHLNVLGALPLSQQFAKLLLEEPYKGLLTVSQGNRS